MIYIYIPGLTKGSYSEIHEHTAICQRLNEVFCGKEPLLDQLEHYVRTGIYNFFFNLPVNKYDALWLIKKLI